MKRILTILLTVISFAAFSQVGSIAISGAKFRVNDTTAYQSAVAAAHSQGYADIYWNNQATTPHWDIWNGSSYDHVFDFNAGGGGGGSVTSVGIAVGTSGSDVNVTGTNPIVSSGTITVNVPDAGASARGVVSTGSQEFGGAKTFTSPVFKTDLNYSDGTTTKNYSFSSKATPTTFPVVVLEPNATSNTNNRIAFDLMPSGSTAPTTDYDGLGTIAWMDICDESKTNIVSNQAHALRLGIGAGDAIVRSVAFNGATARPLSLAIGNTSYLTVLNSGRVQFPFYTALDDQLSGALTNTKYLFVGSGSGIVYQIPGDKLKVTDPTTAADANLVTALGQMWKITGTTTLSGAATIAAGSNRNPLTYTGSWTANANNQYFQSMAPTLTASATTSDNLNIMRIGGSLTSGANNQTLNGLLIENTFINGGAHTGLTNNYLKVVGTNPLFAVSQSQSLFGNTTNTNTITIATSGSDLALTATGGNDLLISHGSVLAFKPGSANLLQMNAYSGQLHTQLMPYSSGATTSTATQRSSTNLNLTITEWTGAASQTNFWTHRATMSSSVNQESYYDLYYGQGSSLPSLANMHFRLKNNGDLLLGAGTSTSATPSARLHVTGGGTTTGKTLLLEASDGTDKFTFVDNGDFQVDKTITAGGTTGDRTINKVAGTVNFAAAATTITVTNSLVTTSSLIFCEVRTNDATATIKNVVPGSGSFVITLNAAATAETSVGFFIVN